MLEKLFYESRPFLFLIIASFATHLPTAEPLLMKLFASILVMCSMLIMVWRVQYRTANRKAS